jgi:hypothetical protein
MSHAIDAYLDTVDLALLKAGASRAHRQGILKDLETHIRETLAQRVKAGEPTEADISAVLSGMGDPTAYAQGVVRPQVRAGMRRRLPSQVMWGFLLAAVGWMGTFILWAFGASMRRPDLPEITLLMLAGAPVVVCVLLSTVLGWSAWRQIGREPDYYWGRFFASILLLAFPLMLLIGSPLLFLAMLIAWVVFVVWRRVGEWHPALPRFLTTQ